MSQRLVAFVLLALCTTTLYAQDIEVIDRTPKTGYEVQQELIATIRATQDLVNAVGEYTYIDPLMLTTLNEQLYLVKFLSYNEIESLASSDDSLWKVREEIEALNSLLADGAGIVAQQTSFGSDFGGSTRLGHDCVEGARYPGLGEGAFIFAPGPCDQTGLTGVAMADVNYPGICPFSTAAGVLVIGRSLAAIARATASALKRFCVLTVFGNDTSTACIVTDIIEVVLKTLFDYLDGCNGKRGDAELVIAYSRAGEIYLSNKQNFQEQDSAMRVTFDNVIATNSTLSTLVIDEKNSTLVELEQGFSGTTQRLIELETQAIENSQRLARVLDEQRTIMRELGIEHLYRDPNTPTAGFSPFGVLQEAMPPSKAKPQNTVFIDANNLFRLGNEGQR